MLALCLDISTSSCIWGGHSCVDEPCPGLLLTVALPVYRQVQEGDKCCCLSRPLLSMELAVGINKWWEIVRGSQGPVEPWALDIMRHWLPLPGQLEMGSQAATVPGQGWAERGAGSREGLQLLHLGLQRHSVWLPTASLPCPLLCIIPCNTSQGGMPGRDTLGCRLCSPNFSEENNIQPLWRCYLYAMFSVPHSGRQLGHFLNYKCRVHSLKIVRGTLIYSKRFTNFNMDSKI